MIMQRSDPLPFDTAPRVLDRLDRERRIEINQLSMASRRIVADYPDAAHWYALQVWERREFAVEKCLVDADVIALVLAQEGEEVVRRGRKWQLKKRPWLPGYVLVRCVWSAAAAMGFKRQKHVLGVVGGLISPLRIPDQNINGFKGEVAKRVEAEEARKADWSYPFRVGHQVRVTAGPFLGFCGELVDLKKGDPSTGQIALRLFGHDTPLTLPLECFERF